MLNIKQPGYDSGVLVKDGAASEFGQYTEKVSGALCLPKPAPETMKYQIVYHQNIVDVEFASWKFVCKLAAMFVDGLIN